MIRSMIRVRPGRRPVMALKTQPAEPQPARSLTERIAAAQSEPVRVTGMGSHELPIAVSDPAQLYRYTVTEQSTYHLWRWHVERNRKSAIITSSGPIRELWINGVYVGREPVSAPRGVPLLGRLLWPLFRCALKHDLMGRQASAALRRVFQD
jgi:hypothetical protein